MTGLFAALVVAVPLLAAAVLLAARRAGWIGWGSVAVSAATLGLAVALPWQAGSDALVRIDRLGAHMAALVALLGLAASWTWRTDGGWQAQARHHAMVACMLLAVLSNNMMLTWAAIEAAMLALLLGRFEAPRRDLLAGVAGLAMALLGCVVLYVAASAVLGPGLPAMRWDRIGAAAGQLAAQGLSLGWLLVLAGGAVCVALCCLAGPATAPVLAPALGGVILASLLRAREAVAGQAEVMGTQWPLIALGLLALLAAGYAMGRERRADRLVGLAALFHFGIASVGFGLGGQGSAAAGLLHLTVALLVLPVLAQCLGMVARLKGGNDLDGIGALLGAHRPLGLALAGALAALAMLPPFGLFAGALIVLGDVARGPLWLVVPLGIGMVGGAGALAGRLVGLCLGPAMPDRGVPPHWVALLPAWVLLAAAAALGLAPAAAGWFAGMVAGLR